MNAILSVAVAVSALIGAVIGYVAAVATFRAQFATVDVRHAALVERIDRDRANDQRTLNMQIQTFSDTLERIERRTDATLRLVANLARAAGAHRSIGEDALAHFLADENNK